MWVIFDRRIERNKINVEVYLIFFSFENYLNIRNNYVILWYLERSRNDTKLNKALDTYQWIRFLFELME